MADLGLKVNIPDLDSLYFPLCCTLRSSVCNLLVFSFTLPICQIKQRKMSLLFGSSLKDFLIERHWDCVCLLEVEPAVSTKINENDLA